MLNQGDNIVHPALATKPWSVGSSRGLISRMVNVPSSPLAAVSAAVPSRRDWIFIGAGLAFGLCLLALVFRGEIETAISVWLNSDAYNHCFLVIPVAAYLAWDRRHTAAATSPRPAAWLSLLAIPVAAAWFAADRLGIMEGRQLMAMTMFQIMVASLLGLRTWRNLSVPLLYLYFLVPFGEFFVAPLQGLVVHFTTASLNLIGIPNFSDGVTLQIPEGTFIVHEACSGLRFLVASAAFGVLYACLIFATPLRRIFFIALSLAIAIIGNCLRVVGIILLAHFCGNAKAIETGHVLWGWLFYLIIGSVLVLVGLVFRQEIPRPEPVVKQMPGRRLTPVVTVLAVIVFLATAPRVAADHLDQVDSGTANTAQIQISALPGCTTLPQPVTTGSAQSIGNGPAAVTSSWSMTYRCDADLFEVTLHRYPARIGVRPLFSSLRAAAAPANWDVIFQMDNVRLGNGAGSSIWHITQASTERGYAAVATALWLDGHPSGAGIRARVDQALNAVRRSALSPMLLVVTHFGARSPNEARHAVDLFLLKEAEPLSRMISGEQLSKDPRE